MTEQRLNGRTALIVGGGTGIGRAIALLFARHGARVVVAGRRVEPLQQVVAEIEGEGGTAVAVTGNVASMDDARAMVDFAVAQYGTVDTLVNCAGVISRTENVEHTTDDEWAWQVDINLKGVFHTTKHCLPIMIENKKGAILNIGSICASVGIPGYATYSATKGGILAYTRVIALQYAAHGIRANVISPGMVHTPMSYVDRPNFDEVVDDVVASAYPIQRLCVPEDIAYAALFLVSDEAGYITGHNLVVDGGFSIK